MTYDNDDSLTLDSFKGKIVKEIEMNKGRVTISFSDETQIEIESGAEYIGSGCYIDKVKVFYSRPPTKMWHLLES